jgi:hypothetical protein
VSVVVVSFFASFLLAACDDDCARLCDRTVLCVEKHVAPAIAAEDAGASSPDDFVCAFDDAEGARATCAAGCAEQASGRTARACVACLADRLTCSTTASLRTCDVDCEPTMFATGTDGEGALTYDYAAWFFTGVDELEGLTCEMR